MKNERLTPQELVNNLDDTLINITSFIEKQSFKYENHTMPMRVKEVLYLSILHYRNARINAKRVELFVGEYDKIVSKSLKRLKISESPLTYERVDKIIMENAA